MHDFCNRLFPQRPPLGVVVEDVAAARRELCPHREDALRPPRRHGPHHRADGRFQVDVVKSATEIHPDISYANASFTYLLDSALSLPRLLCSNPSWNKVMA